ncbi:succinylglutamate desuccinylase [Sesbania bispinosa]|nr:succinylglutamate desuccinylase [Sesbania bispinosa]
MASNTIKSSFKKEYPDEWKTEPITFGVSGDDLESLSLKKQEDVGILSKFSGLRCDTLLQLEKNNSCLIKYIENNTKKMEEGVANKGQLSAKAILRGKRPQVDSEVVEVHAKRSIDCIRPKTNEGPSNRVPATIQLCHGALIETSNVPSSEYDWFKNYHDFTHYINRGLIHWGNNIDVLLEKSKELDLLQEKVSELQQMDCHYKEQMKAIADENLAFKTTIEKLEEKVVFLHPGLDITQTDMFKIVKDGNLREESDEEPDTRDQGNAPC